VLPQQHGAREFSFQPDAEVMVGLYMDAAATDCDGRKTQDTGHRTNRFIDPGHEIEKTIQQGRDRVKKRVLLVS
jgi:hypothetical protein